TPPARRGLAGEPGVSPRLAERRPDVDHALVLDRHEGRADRHDHPLDVGEDLLVVAGRDLDSDLVDGLGLEAALEQLAEEPLAIRDARGLHLEGFVHAASVPADPRPETR